MPETTGTADAWPRKGTQGWQAGDGSIGAAASITLRIAGTAGNIARVRGPPRSRTPGAALDDPIGGTAGPGRSGALTFDALAAWYLDDYTVRRLRTLDTARGRVANLRATFGGWRAPAITTEAIRRYQRTRRAGGAAAATVNRETSALSRMLQLAVRGGQLAQRPVFPERLDEQGPRQGFFEHEEYQAVRRYLPPPYQDILDFAYYSGWRKREMLELPWREVDQAGGVIRLSPQRSKTRVGRVLPISAPIAAVLARRRSPTPGARTRSCFAGTGDGAGVAYGLAGGVSARGGAGTTVT